MEEIPNLDKIKMKELNNKKYILVAICDGINLIEYI